MSNTTQFLQELSNHIKSMDENKSSNLIRTFMSTINENQLSTKQKALFEDVNHALNNDKLNEGEKYEDFFKKMLKKYKVKSISQLDDKEKKKFFDEIEKKWTADDE